MAFLVYRQIGSHYEAGLVDANPNHHSELLFSDSNVDGITLKGVAVKTVQNLSFMLGSASLRLRIS